MSPSKSRVFILGRASRLGSSQSWVNSGSYLAPKSIIPSPRALVYEDSRSNIVKFAARSSDIVPLWYKSGDYMRASPLSLTKLNTLDRGEASVIQLALNLNISTVCIDEAVGRRVARLSGLTLTGSIGILLKAKQQGYPVVIKTAIENMLARNIRLSNNVINFALQQAGEI